MCHNLDAIVKTTPTFPWHAGTYIQDVVTKQQTVPLQQITELVIYNLSKCCSPGHVTFCCKSTMISSQSPVVCNDVVTQNIIEPRAQNHGRVHHSRVLLKDLYVDIQQNVWSGTLPRRKKCYNIGTD